MAETGYGGGQSLNDALSTMFPTPPTPTDDAKNPVVQAAYQTAAKDFRAKEDVADKELATATTRLKGLKVPQLQQLPADPQYQRTDPMSVWGSLAMMFAVFGSMAVKAPFTTALNAAASVMNAYNTGDQTRYTSELKKWQIASQNAARMAEWEHEQYRDQLEGIRTGIEAAKAARPTIAMLNDQVARTLIDAGYPEEAMRVWQRRGAAAKDLTGATERAEKHMMAMQGLQAYVKDHPEVMQDKPELNRLYHEFMAGKNPNSERADTAGQKDAKQAVQYLDALQAGKTVTIGGMKITKKDYDDYVNGKGFDPQTASPKQVIIKQLFDQAGHHAAGGSISEVAQTDEGTSAKAGNQYSLFTVPDVPKDKKDLVKGKEYKMPPGSEHEGEVKVWNGSRFVDTQPAPGMDTALQALQ